MNQSPDDEDEWYKAWYETRIRPIEVYSRERTESLLTSAITYLDIVLSTDNAQ